MRSLDVVLWDTRPEESVGQELTLSHVQALDAIHCYLMYVSQYTQTGASVVSWGFSPEEIITALLDTSV